MIVPMIAPEVASELDRVLENSAAPLRAIREESAAKRPRPESWCKKEILGHLIDSASNNHHRSGLLQLAARCAVQFRFHGFDTLANHY